MKPWLSVFSVIVAVVWFPANRAGAFNADGHRIVAALAYRQLDAATQRRVDDLLKSHPAYRDWKRAYRSHSGVSLAQFAFLEASVWPDEIRNSGDPNDHPHWHFVDYPLRPPEFRFEGRPNPKDDILRGIEVSEDVLEEDTGSKRVRAVHLSWLLHLIGDLHQPLHCASLFNATYDDADGDRGGNRFFVRPGARALKLHAFWDGLMGNSATPRMVVNTAVRLEKQFPESSLSRLRTERTPVRWSLESRRAAITVAYALPSLEGHDSPANALGIDAAYTTRAKDTTEEQVAVAAYRLAERIAQLLP